MENLIKWSRIRINWPKVNVFLAFVRELDFLLSQFFMFFINYIKLVVYVIDIQFFVVAS